MVKILFWILGLIGLLMSFVEHLGESRLRNLEQSIRENLTIPRLIKLPLVIFEKSSFALTCNETIMTIVVMAFFAFLMRHSLFSDIQQYYVNAIIWAASPARWLEDNLGFIGSIVGVPIAVFIALVFGFLLPMLFLLLLVTVFVLIALYPMLGLLWLGNWCKKFFGLSGSFIKISSWALIIASYLALNPLEEIFVSISNACFCLD